MSSASTNAHYLNAVTGYAAAGISNHYAHICLALSSWSIYKLERHSIKTWITAKISARR